MQSRKILLADDSSTIRTMISRVLTSNGYNVITACDGAEAIQKVQEHDIDLAIIDIVMPGIDGYGVCQRFQEMGNGFSNIPILFLTCVESKALELLGNEYGAYLRKPVKAEVLLKAIDKQLSERQSNKCFSSTEHENFD